MHYLDEFLTIDPPGTTVYQRNLSLIVNFCQLLSISLAVEKVTGLAVLLEFLGIVLDSDRMETWLLKDKQRRIQAMLHRWLHKKSTTKREILSLVGVLHHASKVVRPSRTLVCRMYAMATAVRELDYLLTK